MGSDPGGSDPMAPGFRISGVRRRLAAILGDMAATGPAVIQDGQRTQEATPLPAGGNRPIADPPRAGIGPSGSDWDRMQSYIRPVVKSSGLLAIMGIRAPGANR